MSEKIINIAHPPRRTELSSGDLKKIESLRARGRGIYQGMHNLVDGVGQPSVVAVSPRKGEDTELGDRTWIEMRKVDTFGEPEETREHMWFRVELVDLEDGEALSGGRDYVGLTAQGKLLPEALRDPNIVDFDTQSAIMDAMARRLGAVEYAAGQLAIEAAN